MQHEIYHHEGSRPDKVDMRIRPDIRLPNVFQKDEKKDEMKGEGIQKSVEVAWMSQKSYHIDR